MVHNDSLSSDPSDHVRPPPPKPHKHRKARNSDSGGNGKHYGTSGGATRAQENYSSSEDEMRSTTSTYADDGMESASIASEKSK